MAPNLQPDLRPAARKWRCPPPPSEPGEFHRSMSGYRRTPLVESTELAGQLGVDRVLIKDEPWRLGLPAFKMLGASWGVSQALADRARRERRRTFDELRALTAGLGPITLVTATDGNHGVAVARMARLLGVDARIVLADAAPTLVVRHISEEGAEVAVLPEPCDDTVSHAAELARSDRTAVLVQDTSWEGYERVVPQWIVDGYATLFREVEQQLAEQAAAPAALVVVPVGVGSVAQAAVATYRSGVADPAALLAVEPKSAACVLVSLQRGSRQSVATGMTSMAGLNCGTPSAIAWPFLRRGLDAAISVGEDAVAFAARSLRDAGVSSGPCGAASLAGARRMLRGEGAEERRSLLGLTEESVVVLLNTEGVHRARRLPKP